MTEVYIDGKRLDLYTKAAIALTKQINDIAEIQKRQADYTNRFTVPKTPNNMIIAEMLNVPCNPSTKPYKYSSAVIISNGITITSSGIALITETKNRQAYEVIIYAGNYDLYSRIKDKYITEIDWSDLEHVFDKDTWSDSLANTEGYIYPVLDTINGDITKTLTPLLRVDLNYQVPCVFSKTIFDRIMSEAGLTYTGDFIAGDVFSKHLTVADRNYYEDIKTKDSFNGKTDYSPYPNEENATIPIYPFEQQIDIDIVNQASANYNTSTDKYTVEYRGEYVFTLTAKTGIQACEYFRFKIKVNGVLRDTQTYDLHRADLVYTAVDMSLTTTLLLEQGDEVEFYWMFDNDITANALFVYMYECVLDIRQNRLLLQAYNNTVDFSLFLPKIKQIDYLKAIMQQFGLLYQIDSAGAYKFITIEELLNGDAGKSDYTNKLNSEKGESYSIGNYGKINNLKYGYYEKDKIGTEYADYSYEIDIDNLENEVTGIDSIIQASGDFYIFDKWEKIASVHSFENKETDSTLPPKYEMLSNKELKTVMLVGHEIPQIQAYDSDTDTVLANYVYFSFQFPVGQFKDLYWEVLANTYYPKYIEMVQKPLKKNVDFWLTPIDIYFLDMFKIIYLEQYQSYFYLNKISNFQAGKLSDCELIKIN